MLDSDDYLCLSMIEIMYKVMKENVADLVVCGFEKEMKINLSFQIVNNRRLNL